MNTDEQDLIIIAAAVYAYLTKNPQSELISSLEFSHPNEILLKQNRLPKNIRSYWSMPFEGRYSWKWSFHQLFEITNRGLRVTSQVR